MPHCIYLQQGKRNCGLLQEIMDRLRDGKHSEEDLGKLTLMRRRHPNYTAERGIHYSNESASLFNCCQLWNDCTQRKRRFYTCRAVYYTTERNDNVVRILSSIPASQFGYAPDVLCLSPGCEVRLIRNIDTSAGLVTNSTGRVVEIIYDNRDVPSLLTGRYPPAYCIVVHFPGFCGFVSGTGRRFPFTDRHLVPIYAVRFALDKVPKNVAKIQERRFCYRLQFPIDLSTNLTAHRGQGQTWKNCTLSVNLGLDNPQNKIPPDATAIMYVACTRITSLKDLFLSPVYPSVWNNIGRTDTDIERRQHEVELKEKAGDFAARTGMYRECCAELNFVDTYADTESEWNSLNSQQSSLRSTCMLSSDDELQKLRDGLFVSDHPELRVCLKPVETERYIGIDQGLKTFSMVAVDRRRDSVPRVVGAVQVNLVDCGLFSSSQKINAADVLLLLRERSPLFQWMRTSDDDSQQPFHLDKTDRVVVLLEQIAVENKYSQPLSKDLAVELQNQFADVNTCIVKMSQPHVHRRNGPLFKLGSEIVDACNLKPASYQKVQERSSRRRHYSDVEPSDSSDAEVSATNARRAKNEEYKKKKAMSSAVFQYFIGATSLQQAGMQVDIDPIVQQHWKNLTSIDKYDDMGDALLHALDELLCGSSNYQQLLPSASALRRNRTVVIVLLPDQLFWVTMDCVCNEFTIQDFGEASMPLAHLHFSDDSTIYAINSNLPYRLMCALRQFESTDDFLTSTDSIQVTVKQLKGSPERNFSSKAAGALTNACVKTMMTICDELLSSGSVTVDNNKKAGWRYSRKCTTTGRKYVVSRSSGKHLNAVLSCLEWMRTNLPDFVRDRPFKIQNQGKLTFFDTLRKIAVHAKDDDNARLESIRLSKNAIERLIYKEGTGHNFVRKVLGDLILIALNDNQHYIRAISDNYRKHPQH